VQSPRCSGIPTSSGEVRGTVSLGFLGLLHVPSAFPNIDPVALLTTIRLPLQLATFGLPARLQTSTTCIVEGDPAWAWDELVPDLGIPTITTTKGTAIEGWGLDHVVLLVPDLDDTAAMMGEVLGSPRLRTSVEGRPTAFYRAGPLIEVIESPVRAPAIFGIALVTEQSLEETALAWKERGLTVTGPHPAMQPGREIITVKGTNAGFAVMSPDGATGTYR